MTFLPAFFAASFPRCLVAFIAIGWLAMPIELCAADPSQQTTKKPAGPRPLWTSSRVIGSPEPPLPYKVEKTFLRLPLRQPLFVAPEPGTTNLLVIEHLGNWAGPARIRRIQDDCDSSESTALLELDRIAYSLAFHPNYEKNGYLFVGSNGPVNAAVKKTRIS